MAFPAARGLLVGSGLGPLPDLIALAGTAVLVLMLVAIGAFAYRSLKGDGVQWPEETDEASDDDVRRGRTDDEWKYY
jgi:hypothetical protein